ncbi:MAG: serine/threonine protein kinase [Fimbriimonadaceae bacterium]|nr:serine/threonine protein kinase [Fimbriimonadaceae bacterium]
MKLPAPLPEGSMVGDRFIVSRTLGRGGFGITYLAEDLARSAVVALKELAPPEAIRQDDGSLSFSAIGPSAAQRLRHQFVSEVSILERARVPRVPRVMGIAHDNGTAYYATEYIAGSITLATVLQRDGRLTEEQVAGWMRLLLDTLNHLHKLQILHRDIKPTNVLVAPDGVPYLIDFGSARSWAAFFTQTHTVQFTPGFAPLEQMTEKATRGPGTDLYGLCATAYTLLSGSPPLDSLARSAGQELPRLSTVRPDLSDSFVEAIHAGLALHLAERPPSALELLALLNRSGSDRGKTGSVLDLDQKALRLKRFRFDQRECPVSGEPLERPKPLKKGTCPVCRAGRIVVRKIEQRLCPSCRVGLLSEVSPTNQLPFCPSCRIGRMKASGGFLGVGAPKGYRCSSCDFHLAKTRDGWEDPAGEVKDLAQWRAQAGRPQKVWTCDVCPAQLDELPDGRWRRVVRGDDSQDPYDSLTPDEWARVANGLDPGAGNAECNHCQSDFFCEGGTTTLLTVEGAHQNAFVASYFGEAVKDEDLPWVAVGKSSGNPGMVCWNSEIEFDDALNGHHRLVRTRDRRLAARLGESHSLPDWHRFAQDLPAVGLEQELQDELLEALAEAYREGEIPFDQKQAHLFWRGKATQCESEGEGFVPVKAGMIEITSDGLTFGSLLRRRFNDINLWVSAMAEDDLLVIQTRSGEAAYLIAPQTLSFRLVSGKQEVTLFAGDLATRINLHLKKS